MNECKIIYLIFTILLFWVINDFVHNFQVFLTDQKMDLFWAYQKIHNVLNRIFVFKSFFSYDS